MRSETFNYLCMVFLIGFFTSTLIDYAVRYDGRELKTGFAYINYSVKLYAVHQPLSCTMKDK